MGRTGKIISIIVAIIIILLLVLWGVLYGIASHIDWRSFLEKQVKEKTGRTLTIKGPLEWHIFPHISIEAKDVSLSNPPKFSQGQFAGIQTLNVSVATLPLLGKHIEVKQFQLIGANIHLIKVSQTQANWSFSDGKPSEDKKAVADQEDHGGSTSVPSVTIPSVKIENSVLTYQDQTTGNVTKISGFDLSMSNVQQGSRFPIKVSFYLDNKKPAVKGKISLNAQALWKGTSFDLSPATLTTALQGAVLPKGYLNTNFNGDLAVAPGRFSLNDGKLTLNGLVIDDIKAVAVMNNDNLVVSPIQAKLYQGGLNGTYKMGLKTSQSQFNFQFDHIQIAPFIEAFTPYKNIYGLMNAKINGAITAGNMATLNGQGSFNFTNGRYQGVDLGHLYRVAVNTIKPNSLSNIADSGMTKFADVHANFNINRGVVSTNNLLLLSPILRVTGKGSLSLPAQYVNMTATVTGMQGSSENPRPVGPNIPFILKGPIASVKPVPDIQALLQQNLKQNVNSLIKDKLKNINLNKLF